MWPLTYATKCNFISYFFIGFAILPIMVNRRNYIHWLAIPPGARIRRNDHFLLLELLERSTNWFVDRSSNFSTDKTEEQWRRGSSAMGYQNSGKLWVESKHLGQLSTILHPLTEIRGQKICSNGQQAKFVDCSRILSPDKPRKRELEGKLPQDVKF